MSLILGDFLDGSEVVDVDEGVWRRVSLVVSAAEDDRHHVGVVQIAIKLLSDVIIAVTEWRNETPRGIGTGRDAEAVEPADRFHFRLHIQGYGAFVTFTER